MPLRQPNGPGSEMNGLGAPDPQQRDDSEYTVIFTRAEVEALLSRARYALPAAKAKLETVLREGPDE